jgi:hypothetical protein
MVVEFEGSKLLTSYPNISQFLPDHILSTGVGNIDFIIFFILVFDSLIGKHSKQ